MTGVQFVAAADIFLLATTSGLTLVPTQPQCLSDVNIHPFAMSHTPMYVKQ